jgi:hypothetical protein
MFFSMKRTTLNAIMELVEMYLHCHRISMDGINDLGQLVVAVSQTAAKTTLAAAALNTAGQPVSPGAVGSSDFGEVEDLQHANASSIG